MKFELNQKVSVPQPFGYAPVKGIIKEFVTNQYNVKCAKVKILCDGEVKIVALRSLECQAEKEKKEVQECHSFMKPCMVNVSLIVNYLH